MKFLDILSRLTPLIGVVIAQLVPGLHPAAVPHIIAGITGAESAGGDKKAIAIAIAQQGIEVAVAQGVPIGNASALEQDIPEAVQIGVDIINALHKAPTVQAAADAK